MVTFVKVLSKQYWDGHYTKQAEEHMWSSVPYQKPSPRACTVREWGESAPVICRELRMFLAKALGSQAGGWRHESLCICRDPLRMTGAAIIFSPGNVFTADRGGVVRHLPEGRPPQVSELKTEIEEDPGEACHATRAARSKGLCSSLAVLPSLDFTLSSTSFLRLSLLFLLFSFLLDFY